MKRYGKVFNFISHAVKFLLSYSIIVLNIDGFINLSFWMKNDDKLNIPTFFHVSVYKKWRRKTNCFKEKNNFLHLFQSQLNGQLFKKGIVLSSQLKNGSSIIANEIYLRNSDLSKKIFNDYIYYIYF